MKRLEKFLTDNGISFDSDQIARFTSYQEQVLDWNEKVNLTAIKDPLEFELKHFVDSVAICPVDEMKRAERIIDVGTGAGFPGIPLAILYPEKRFTLMDSLGKRIKILKEITDLLNIPNVELIHGRAEELSRMKDHREKYDLCVSRAVANLAVLSEYCLPFVKVGGSFAAYKTVDAAAEVKDSERAIDILGGKMDRIVEPSIEGIENHQILIINKLKQTAAKYPRKAGTPSKEPLK